MKLVGSLQPDNETASSFILISEFYDVQLHLTLLECTTMLSLSNAQVNNYRLQAVFQTLI